jgi:hypothetical protein
MQTSFRLRSAPRPVQSLLLRARRAYHAAPVHERPVLDQHHNAMTLFQPHDLLTLALLRLWPLPAPVVGWLSTPARRRSPRRKAEVVRARFVA